MERAKLIGNRIIMVYNDEILVMIKNNEVLQVVCQEGSYNIDPTCYDEAYIIKKNEISFDVNDMQQLLNYISIGGNIYEKSINSNNKHW